MTLLVFLHTLLPSPVIPIDLFRHRHLQSILSISSAAKVMAPKRKAATSKRLHTCISECVYGTDFPLKTSPVPPSPAGLLPPRHLVPRRLETLIATMTRALPLSQLKTRKRSRGPLTGLLLLRTRTKSSAAPSTVPHDTSGITANVTFPTYLLNPTTRAALSGSIR